MSRRITLADIGAEPFRVLFPAAIVAGAVGALLWPLHFWGWVAHYPGESHARMMANGFFGGVIFGFLGTALPRVLGAKVLGTKVVLGLLAGHLLMMGSYVTGANVMGDSIFLTLLVGFLSLLAMRFGKREDLPPPSFTLVLMGLVCAGAGVGLSIAAKFQDEPNAQLALLQKLLAYQGLVLLPILGVGGFLLPRFFGLPAKRDLPESPVPTAEWKRGALIALIIGLIIFGSFFVEMLGRLRVAHAIRFGAAFLFVLFEIPVFQFGKISNSLAMSLRLAFVFLLVGFLSLIFFPAYRVGLLHLTLVGGFAVVTLTVATRVVYGHSGNGKLLAAPNRWFWVVIGMILLGMATRIIGDFIPKIMATHYTYGALLWAAGLALWSVRVLPKVLVAEGEE